MLRTVLILLAMLAVYIGYRLVRVPQRRRVMLYPGPRDRRATVGGILIAGGVALFLGASFWTRESQPGGPQPEHIERPAVTLAPTVSAPPAVAPPQASPTAPLNLPDNRTLMRQNLEALQKELQRTQEAAGAERNRSELLKRRLQEMEKRVEELMRAIEQQDRETQELQQRLQQQGPPRQGSRAAEPQTSPPQPQSPPAEQR